MKRYGEADIYDIISHVNKYNYKDNSKAFCILLKTTIYFVMSLYYSNYIFLNIQLPCIIFRFSVIYHDCIHNSFFTENKYNIMVANILELIVMQDSNDFFQ